MRSLIADLVDATQALRAPSGTVGAADDVFRARAGFLSANGGADAENSLGITVENGTRADSYDIEIRQIAEAHKVAGTALSSNSTDLGYSGVIRLGTVDGESADITIDGGMTLGGDRRGDQQSVGCQRSPGDGPEGFGLHLQAGPVHHRDRADDRGQRRLRRRHPLVARNPRRGRRLRRRAAGGAGCDLHCGWRRDHARR